MNIQRTLQSDRLMKGVTGISATESQELVKEFRIFSNIFRNKIDDLDDKVMEISCGLRNYHLLSFNLLNIN